MGTVQILSIPQRSADEHKSGFEFGCVFMVQCV